ncbi:MAG: DNA repair protein RadA, partial [Burkholderiaceae bacterium]|nr:DNA repair protein RadA [Burkholderiaceae bacterium]
MSKIKTRYVCIECGAITAKWQGQCSSCQAWNTLEESREDPAETAHRFAPLTQTSEIVKLSEVQARDLPRVSTGIGELDRVMG